MNCQAVLNLANRTEQFTNSWPSWNALYSQYVYTIYLEQIPYELLQKMVERDLCHNWTSFLE